jgi:hypothetical protein
MGDPITGMFNMLKLSIGDYMQHPASGFGLLCAVRFLTAQQYDYAFCANFNKGFLMNPGVLK